MLITESKIKSIEVISFENRTGLKITLSPLGASVYGIEVPDNGGKRRIVTLTPDNEETFAKKFYGKTVGRTAGRIENAVFDIDGKHAELEKNNFGTDNLHGGSAGLHAIKFKCDSKQTPEYTDAVFTYFSPNGEGGYFGNVNITVTYRIYESENRFVVIYDASADTKTLLNLTNHVYLNLSGDLRETVEGHIFYLNASRVGKLNERLIAKGIEPVSKESDFTVPHKIGDYINSAKLQSNTCGYDHPFFLNERGLSSKACELYSESSGINLTVATTYPCVVVYTNGKPRADMTAVGGKKDVKYLAVCLECQYHPDGIHACPDDCGILSPEKPYHEETEFTFTVK